LFLPGQRIEFITLNLKICEVWDALQNICISRLLLKFKDADTVFIVLRTYQHFDDRVSEYRYRAEKNISDYQKDYVFKIPAGFSVAIKEPVQIKFEMRQKLFVLCFYLKGFNVLKFIGIIYCGPIQT